MDSIAQTEEQGADCLVKQDVSNGQNDVTENGQSERDEQNGMEQLPTNGSATENGDELARSSETHSQEDAQTEDQDEEVENFFSKNDGQTDSPKIISAQILGSDDDEGQVLETNGRELSDLAGRKDERTEQNVDMENVAREVEGRPSDDDEEIEDDNLLALSSHDVINNNTPRVDVDTEDQDSVDKGDGSNIDGIDGYVGMDAFPGGNQSHELLCRQIDGREEEEEGSSEEEDVEKLLTEEGGSTDNSQLAQLIVEHVIGSVVSSFNVDEASSATEKDIEEVMSQQSPRSQQESPHSQQDSPRSQQESPPFQQESIQFQGDSPQSQEQSPRSPVIGQRLNEDDVPEDIEHIEEGKKEEEDRAMMENVSAGKNSPEENHNEEDSREEREEPLVRGIRHEEEMENQVVEELDVIKHEEDTKSVGSTSDRDPEIKPNLPEEERLEDGRELRRELVSGAGDFHMEGEEPKLVKREESIDMSDTECGSMGRLPKLDPLPAYPEFPQNYGNYKVCRPVAPGVKECIILDTGEGIICKKTKETGKTVITCKHKHNVGEEEADASALSCEPVLDDQQNSNSDGQTVAEILQSMNLEIIDVKASEIRRAPDELRDSSLNLERRRLSPHQPGQSDETSVAYMTVDKSQSPRNKAPGTQATSERSFFSEQDLLCRSCAQDEQDVTDRQRREEEMMDRRRKEEEMLREQMILEKVRRDMAEKERAMRERQENREKQERREKQEYLEGRERENNSAMWYMGDISSINYSQDVTRDTLPHHTSQPAMSGDGSHVTEAERRAREERINRYLRETQESAGEMYARLPDQSTSRLDEKSPSRLENELQRDKAILSELYAKYNIPPPQCNVSASLGESIPPPQDHSSSLLEGSSRLSSDIEAPPPKSGSVPPFKTLHEQQVGWMRMFHTLEEQHQYELQSQYRQHQESIFKLQQQMEDQLFSQQQSLKKKLAAHKEVLGSPVSPSTSHVGEMDGELVSTSQMIGSYPGEVLIETPESIRKTRRQRRSPTQRRTSRSPPWREIYREIRGRGVDSDDTESEDVRTHSSGTITDQSQASLPRGGVYSSPMPLLRKAAKRPSSSPHGADRSGSPLAVRERSSPGPGEIYRTPPKSWHSPRVSQREESPLREDMRTPPRSRQQERITSPRGSDGNRTPLQTRTPPRHGRVERSPPRVERSPPRVERSPPRVERSPPRMERSPPRSGARGDHQELSLGGSFIESPSRHRDSRERCHTPTQIERIKEISHDSVSNMELSPRSSLREKHAKHLADLREYYEQELQDLRSALKVSGETTLRGSDAAISAENQSLLCENQELTRQNKEVIRQNQEMGRQNKELEGQLEVANRKLQELSQRVHGLEKRALVYADNYKEAQDKICTFRNKVEELQYTEHQQKDVIEQLQHQTQTQTETIKHLKKVQDEQMHVIQQDRNAYHKLADKHETLERDINILKDTLNSTENNLYDARKEIVELNRTISKLELENKRLGRENDNIRYRATQHLHKSSSPLGHSSDVPESKSEYIHVQQSSKEFTPKKAPERPVTQELSPPCRDDTRRRPPSPDSVRSAKVRVSSGNSKPYRVSNESDDTEDTSPVMRAERELLRLQQVMRQTDNIDTTPKAPKLQKKKYYGSDIHVGASQNSNRASTSSPKIVRQKSPSGSPNSRSSYRQPKITDKKDKSKDLLKSLEPKNSQFKNGTALDARMLERSGRGDHRGNTINGDSSSSQRIPAHSKNSSQSGASSERSQTRKPKRSEKIQSENNVEDTIERVQSGEVIARPGWENAHTTLVTASSPNVKNSEDLENQLDVVEKELGSVRMSLKRYHVLKSSI
ncbi:hypothetical protein FSP39_006269 [Pinctada imbricata]|uniref:Uncharacterized protein n=1 Tax=Pinctada imbricata TaxID=66713 RepID=A0AA88XEM5_PINIB|nr:hypothetical protein FSP39_006269 [Pinctada imbricata]